MSNIEDCSSLIENNFVEENMSIQEKNLLELRSVEQADTATQSRSNNEEIETSSKDKSKPQDTETERSYTLRYSHQDPDETSSTQRVPPPTSPKLNKKYSWHLSKWIVVM
jgi:cell division protein FtsN